MQDRDEFSEDDIGIECGSPEAVRKIAIEALPDIAKFVLSNGDHRVIAVTVRDEAGKNVFQASLTLDAGRWLARRRSEGRVRVAATHRGGR